MASTPQQPQGAEPDLNALKEAIGSGDPLRAMPALTQLRFCSDEEAVPYPQTYVEKKPVDFLLPFY